MVTLCFREEHVRAPGTEVRVCAQDLRERLTMTRTTLGSATVSLQELATAERVRLRLDSPNPEGRAAGFCTVQCWRVEREQVKTFSVCIWPPLYYLTGRAAALPRPPPTQSRG